MRRVKVAVALHNAFQFRIKTVAACRENMIPVRPHPLPRSLSFLRRAVLADDTNTILFFSARVCSTAHRLATCRRLSFALRQTSFQPETFSCGFLFVLLFFPLPFPSPPYLRPRSTCGTSRLIILILHFHLVSRGTFRAS